MTNNSLITVEEICDVEIIGIIEHHQLIEEIILKNKEKKINLKSLLQDDLKIKIGTSSNYDKLEKVIQIENPHTREVSNDSLEWLLTTLHEIGHAHNQYQYKSDQGRTRYQFATTQLHSIEEVTDVLNDEMQAWSFTLNKLKELGISPNKEIEADKIICKTYLESYMESALCPLKAQSLPEIKPTEYKQIIIALYQKWLNTEMPKLGIDYAKKLTLAEHEDVRLKMMELFKEENQNIDLHLLGQTNPFRMGYELKSLQNSSGVQIYVSEDAHPQLKSLKTKLEEINSTKPRKTGAIQLISDLNQKEGNFTYAVIFTGNSQDNQYSPRMNLLRTHLDILDTGGIPFCYEFKKINIPEMFAIEELKGYDGLIVF